MRPATPTLGVSLLAAVATFAAESATPAAAAPDPVAVQRHADVLPAGREYFQLRAGLANCKAKFIQEKAGRVAFLGGSITFNGGWRDELMRDLQQRFPETTFDFIAAGIPSIGSNGHAFRLERDVLARGPVDLLFVEAGVNDGTNIPDKPDLILRSMEGVVRHLRTVNPLTDIVAMHFVWPEAIAAYDAGKVPLPVAQHERVAEHYGCPSLNLALEVTERIKAGQFTWASGFNDVHPPPYGQRLYANSMTRMLAAGFAAAVAPKAHTLPATPLDPWSYAQGHFGKLEAAKLGQGFTFDPAWKPERPAGTRDGFVNVPALTATAPGSEVTVDFTGTAIGLLLAAGPDTCVLEFSVDGGPFTQLDSFTPWSGGLYLPWPIMLADTLKPGPHTVTVRTTARAAGRTGLHIIQILEN
jgi:lysophospholipase L1-like esterase